MPARVAGDRVRSEPHRPHRPAGATPTARSATSSPPRACKAGDHRLLEPGDDQRLHWSATTFPLELIPPSTTVHASRWCPARGAQIARSAGAGLELVAIEHGNAQLKMPSGEIRLVHAQCRATIGVVGNGDHGKQSLGKAGRNRWLGRRPRVRGVAMNPVDHPTAAARASPRAAAAASSSFPRGASSPRVSRPAGAPSSPTT